MVDSLCQTLNSLRNTITFPVFPLHCLQTSGLRKLTRNYIIVIELILKWGTWVAQSVKHWSLAQIMISRFMSVSPTSGYLLSAQSPLWILCLPVSLPFPYLHAHMLALSLSLSLSLSLFLSLSFSLSKINKHYKKDLSSPNLFYWLVNVNSLLGLYWGEIIYI